VTASKGLRARRSDAGVVRVTERDVAVLRWLGEMFGAPMAVVADLYGVGERVARRHAARLERAGYASRQLAPGGTWLVPTRRGLRFAGLDHEPWSLVAWKGEHVATVSRLRLTLQEQYPEAVWTSERAIRSRWAGSGARVRFADGQLDFPGTTCVGIELELHRKHAREYGGIAGDVDPAFDQVWWFCRTRDQAWLRGVLDGVPKSPRPEHHVIALAGELAHVLGVRS
jgi:hypothetical protein